jgi:hypothetical protein
MPIRWSFLILACLAGTAFAASPAQWRSQSIYFLLTDRFARADGSTTASCDTSARVSYTEPPFIGHGALTRETGILWWYLARHYQTSQQASLTTVELRVSMTNLGTIARLYTRNGLYSNLDNPNHRATSPEYIGGHCIPRVLAARHVSIKPSPHWYEFC